MSRRSNRRGKGAQRQMDICLFSQQNKRHAKKTKQNDLSIPKKMSRQERNNLTGRLMLLAFAEGKPDEICRKTHMLAKLEGYKGHQYVMQAINQSGEPDGKATAEDPENLILLPKVNEIIEFGNGKKLRVCGYNLAGNTVDVCDATAKRKGSALEAKRSKKSKTKEKSQAKPQAKPKKKAASATPKRKKKSMDKPTTSSNESVKESDVFTVQTVLKSFANPRDDLFNRSCSYIVVDYNMDGCTLERIYDR